MKTIDVIIDTDGNIEVQTSGFAGAECKKATAELERQLGKVTHDEVTSEYHKRPVTTIKARG
tara:strand:- start:245 stop:430 length:186 start_codon:yes stop_codon:yes gene_type:complete